MEPRLSSALVLFFFNDTAPTEIYTLSLHDALPICSIVRISIRPSSRRTSACGSCTSAAGGVHAGGAWVAQKWAINIADRKSTRLNSSHANISYAVFCLKKKQNRTSMIQACDCHAAS